MKTTRFDSNIRQVGILLFALFWHAGCGEEPPAPDPAAKLSPESDLETADAPDSTPAAPVAPAADLSAPVGAEAPGDEPPF